MANDQIIEQIIFHSILHYFDLTENNVLKSGEAFGVEALSFCLYFIANI